MLRTSSSTSFDITVSTASQIDASSPVFDQLLAISTIGISLQSWPLRPPLSYKTPWCFNKASWVSHMVYTPSMQCLVYKTKKLLSYARCESVATAGGGGLEVMRKFNTTMLCRCWQPSRVTTHGIISHSDSRFYNPFYKGKILVLSPINLVR